MSSPRVAAQSTGLNRSDEEQRKVYALSIARDAISGCETRVGALQFLNKICSNKR